MTRTVMIDVENLTKRYGRFVALDGISFQAVEGEILGFLGPNGAGKTTTMRILTGYTPPTSGRASVAGFDVFDDSLEMRRHVGYLPETVPLYRDMTVRGYVDYIAQLHGIADRRRRVDEVLEQVGMHDRQRSLIRTLSKGMRQRVGLAQALVHDPEVLILDEPTIGLDPQQVQDVRRLIHTLGERRTVLLSTHILSEAEQLCDRIAIIDRGRIIAVGTPAELQSQLQRGRRLFVRVDSGASTNDMLRLIKAVPGVEQVQAERGGYVVTVRDGADARPALASAIVGHGAALLELRPLALTLEEMFLEFTTRAESPSRRQ
jgi:ABC-2 type transport system ATP-binding protein